MSFKSVTVATLDISFLYCGDLRFIICRGRIFRFFTPFDSFTHMNAMNHAYPFHTCEPCGNCTCKQTPIFHLTNIIIIILFTKLICVNHSTNT